MNTHCNKSLFNLILQKMMKLYIMFLYFKGVIKMGVFIGGIIAGVVIIFLGVILAKSKNSKLWHILSVIGTGVLTVFIVLTISFCADNGKDYGSPALANTNWREQKTYSQDYQLNEETSICISTLDDLSGYAVYNTENGERIGTLACPNYQIGTGEQELKIADVNGDKSNDIGVIMQNSTVIWYKYSPNKEYSKDNPNGRFETISQF